MSDGSSREELLRRSRSNLVDVILAQIGQIDLLQKALGIAAWETHLLADQRDAVLAFLDNEEHKCSDVEWCKWCALSDRIHDILITDSRDAAVVPGSGEPAKPVQFHRRSRIDSVAFGAQCTCGAQWLTIGGRCASTVGAFIVTRRDS